MEIINICNCLNQPSNLIFGMDISDFVTVLISVLTLLLNILFYIIIAPRISFRYQKKEDFLKYSSEFINYLAKINSLDSFDGVLTQIKTYCITIELLFKDGVAPEPLHTLMEDIFQSIRKRKRMTSEEEICIWENEFRDKTKELRKALAKYTGVF